jgi:hypothetical protein
VHLYRWGAIAHHQPEVFDRSARRGEGGRGFREVDAGALHNLAGDDFQLVGQVRVLEDHLQQNSLIVTRLRHLGELGLDVVELPRDHLADVDHHIDLVPRR